MTPKHINAIVNDSHNEPSQQREATINRTESGPVGAAVFVTPEELEQLNVDPDATDTVAIRVEDGFLLLESQDGTNQE